MFYFKVIFLVLMKSNEYDGMLFQLENIKVYNKKIMGTIEQKKL